jgi:LysR family nitrogen assimilation transcriptional regulator
VNLKHLRYFVEIIEQGSLMRAAETLFVAQPSLSQHIRNLEQELGVKLFDRSVKGMVPTEAGQELLQHARVILAHVDSAEEAVRARSAEPQGSVVLGLPPSVSAILTVPFVVEMQRVLPNVSLRIAEGYSGYVLNWLQAGQVDLGVLYGIQRAPGIVARELFQEQLYLICPPGFAGDRTSVPFHDLGAVGLVLPGRHHGLRDTLERFARDHDVPLDVKVEVDAFTQMKALVAHDVGCTVLPYGAVKDEVARGELGAMRIVEPTVERTMYLAQASGRPATRAQRATEELLERCVRECVAEPLPVKARAKR